MTEVEKEGDPLYSSYARWKGESVGSNSNVKNIIRRIINYMLSIGVLKTDVIKALRCSKNARIIELGCGQGRQLMQLYSAGYKNLEGLDFAPAYSQSFPSDIKYYNKDIFLFLEIAPSLHYDAVICIDFIEHFDQKQLHCLFYGIKSMLKDNGVLIVRVPNMATGVGHAFGFGDLTHKTHFTSSSLTQLATHHGFVPEIIRSHTPLGLSLVPILLYPLRIAFQLIHKLVMLSFSIRNEHSGPNLFASFQITSRYKK